MNNSYTPVQMVKAMRAQTADTELRVAKYLIKMAKKNSDMTLEMYADEILSGRYRDDN